MEDLEREIEEAMRRCKAVADGIDRLPSSTITDSCKRTLLRLVTSELKFLTQLSSTSPNFSNSISVNIGYLESVVHILQQPSVTGVSRVCKPVPLSSGKNSKPVHVDIVCMLDKDPVWFIVSDRNPKYISWLPSHKNKGLQMRIEQLLTAAQSYSTLKPAYIVLFFSNGLDSAVSKKLRDEFGAFDFGNEFGFIDIGFFEELDDGWVNVIARSYGKAKVFQIVVDCIERVGPRLENTYIRVPRLPELSEVQFPLILGEKFCALVSRMSSRLLDVESADPEALLGEDLLNFDTTALIAIVSGISNGGSEKLLDAPETEMKKRFKGNVEFVIAQVKSELQDPILEKLTCMISGKIGMICRSVHLEFQELVSMCGGPNEKLRADRLLQCLMIVPDCPSVRMMGIPTTRKIALKNKVVFGTGDHWHASTVTANMGFVRAIAQTDKNHKLKQSKAKEVQFGKNRPYPSTEPAVHQSSEANLSTKGGPLDDGANNSDYTSTLDLSSPLPIKLN